MKNNGNIFTYARSKVDNKGLLTKIKHSSHVHGVRSAVGGTGSATSKGLAVLAKAGRSALKLIPIPVVGDLLVLASSQLEEKIRSKRLEKNRSSSTTLEDEVKFTVKQLSIEELDRYRWKLKDAMVEVNNAANKFNSNLNSTSQDSKPCDTSLEMAIAIAQAERRHHILFEQCSKLINTLQLATQWCDQAKIEIDRIKSDFNENHFQNNLKDAITAMNYDFGVSVGQKTYMSGLAMLTDNHKNCGDYCYLESDKKEGSAIIKSNLSALLREVSEPVESKKFERKNGIR
jgi:hypothetical protein